MGNIKKEFVDLSIQASKEIRELAIFAEASKYIYEHFTTSADQIKDVKIMPNKGYGISVEEVIQQITDQTITRKLYENVVVRSYGTLEVYIQKIATLLITNFPTKYIGNKEVKVSQLFDGDIEAIKKRFIIKTITDNTSNKNMYDAVTSLLKPFDIDLKQINNHETNIRDIYALRNLIVHKNCEIDSKFIESYSHSSGMMIGSKLDVNYENMTYAVNRINKFMSSIYESMDKKHWNVSQ